MVLAFGSAPLPFANRGCASYEIDVVGIFNLNTKYIGGVKRYARCYLANTFVNLHSSLRSS